MCKSVRMQENTMGVGGVRGVEQARGRVVGTRSTESPPCHAEEIRLDPVGS